MVNRLKDHVGTAEACALLGVKPATLYTYVSRGLVRSVGEEGAKKRVYRLSDLRTLKDRAETWRRGTRPAAWLRGLGSGVCVLGEGGPVFRGRSSTDLARDGHSFESVAELLWTGRLPGSAPRWAVEGLGASPRRLAQIVPPGTPPVAGLPLAAGAMGLRDAARFGAQESAEQERARSMILRLAAFLALGIDAQQVYDAYGAGSVAATILKAFRHPTGGDAERAVNRMLLLSADAGPDAAAGAACAAAACGADLYSCVAAALSAIAGPAPSGEFERVEAMVTQTAAGRVQAVLTERLRRGEPVPGFGGAASPGDGRPALLIQTARSLPGESASADVLFEIVRVLEGAGYAPPTFAAGLVAVALALGLPAGAAAGIHAVGRVAGLVAHVLEGRMKLPA